MAQKGRNSAFVCKYWSNDAISISLKGAESRYLVSVHENKWFRDKARCTVSSTSSSSANRNASKLCGVNASVSRRFLWLQRSGRNELYCTSSKICSRRFSHYALICLPNIDLQRRMKNLEPFEGMWEGHCLKWGVIQTKFVPKIICKYGNTNICD